MATKNPPKVSLQELATFTRQLAFLLMSGLSIHQVLNYYGKLEHSALATVVAGIDEKIRAGHSLSHAARAYPSVFSEVYVGMLEMGETSSSLAHIVEKLADFLERELRLRRKIISTLTYPALVLGICSLCLAVFLLFVLPTLVPLFAGLGVQLPLPTRILLGLGEILHLLLGGLAVAGLLGWFFRRQLSAYLDRSGLGLALAESVLRLPVIGPVAEKILTARVLFSMATLLRVGVSMFTVLETSSRVCGNQSMRGKLEKACDSVADGNTLHDALHSADAFAPGVLHMIRAGEDSSDLPRILNHLAGLLEDDTELALVGLVALLEPIIMVGMGVAVGFIVLSALLPTVQLLNANL